MKRKPVYPSLSRAKNPLSSDLCQYASDRIYKDITLPPELYRNIYSMANRLIDRLLQECIKQQKEYQQLQIQEQQQQQHYMQYEPYHQEKKECPFVLVYGAVLAGGVQKQIMTLSNKGNIVAPLIFFYQTSEKQHRKNHWSWWLHRHQRIWEWIQKTIEMIKRQTSTITILNSNDLSLNILERKMELHISLVSTYRKRQYCCFGYKSKNIHVYPYLDQELSMMATDLIEEWKRDQDYMNETKHNNREWNVIMERNIVISLSLLRVYYIREISLRESVRLAIMFLKVWQNYVMNQQEVFIPLSIETFCAFIFAQLSRGLSPSNINNIRFIDIVQSFFELINGISKIVQNKQEIVVINWPYELHKDQSLFKKLTEEDIAKQLSSDLNVLILDNIMQSTDRRYAPWSQLAEKANRTLTILSQGNAREMIDEMIELYNKEKDIVIRASPIVTNTNENIDDLGDVYLGQFPRRTVEAIIIDTAQIYLSNRSFLPQQIFTVFINMCENQPGFNCQQNFDTLVKILKAMKHPHSKDPSFHFEVKHTPDGAKYEECFFCFPSRQCMKCQAATGKPMEYLWMWKDDDNSFKPYPMEFSKQFDSVPVNKTMMYVTQVWKYEVCKISDDKAIQKNVTDPAGREREVVRHVLQKKHV